MGPPNATWEQIISQAKAQADILRQTDLVKNIQNILQTNVSVCSSLGQPFVTQMSHIYQDSLNVYRFEICLASDSTSMQNVQWLWVVEKTCWLRKLHLDVLNTTAICARHNLCTLLLRSSLHQLFA